MNGGVIVTKPQDSATKQGRKISSKRNEMFSKGPRFQFARNCSIILRKRELIMLMIQY